MEIVFVITVGILFSLGLFFILRRSYFRLLIGLCLLGNAVNLLIFVAGRLVKGGAPLIKDDALFIKAPWADPLPQALVLTAIVISFGLVAFAALLFRKTSIAQGSDDVEGSDARGDS